MPSSPTCTSSHSYTNGQEKSCKVTTHKVTSQAPTQKQMPHLELGFKDHEKLVNEVLAFICGSGHGETSGQPFGRFVKIIHEGAIVSLYEGQIRFIRPNLDASEPNAYIIEKYNFEPSRPQKLTVAVLIRSAAHILALFPAQPERDDMSLANGYRNDRNDHREGRALMDLQETHSSAPSATTRMVQDWDELSGRLCIRSVQSRFTQYPRCRRTVWRVTLVDFV
ncbi:hypothetical protein BD769DRAFT_1383959 [Suillus cothurnatus]|nr:hypothetical protein BD769DRAFT_1383959 [Suillus cothurnatus]